MMKAHTDLARPADDSCDALEEQLGAWGARQALSPSRSEGLRAAIMAEVAGESSRNANAYGPLVPDWWQRLAYGLSASVAASVERSLQNCPNRSS